MSPEADAIYDAFIEAKMETMSATDIAFIVLTLCRSYKALDPSLINHDWVKGVIAQESEKGNMGFIEAGIDKAGDILYSVDHRYILLAQSGQYGP